MPANRLAASPPSKPKARDLRTRVWSAGRLIILAIGLSATFGTFFLTGMRVANRAREVKVPDVQGLGINEATRALAAVGLVLKVDTRRPDAKVPIDHVLAQEPDAGTVIRRQRAIRVRVSDGQKDPTVPAVVGMPVRTAEVVLSQEKIEIGERAEIRTRTTEPDMVLAQDPVAKNRAAKVSLLINRGEGSLGYVMPDVIGAMANRVVDILRRHGFRVTISAEVPYPGLPAGVVIRQTPQAGFRVEHGEAVQLEVTR
jgi:eukaryotic-like serine/threonine-protein kinase